MPKIGIIHSGSSGNQDHKRLIDIFLRTLEQEGFVDGQGGFSIDGAHFGDDSHATLRSHANTLVANNVTVLVAGGGTRASQIAKDATSQNPQIAVVFTTANLPVRPATNTTGICAHTADLDRARLSLLRELMPTQNQLGALINSDRFPPGTLNTQRADLDNAAVQLGLQPLSYQDVGNGNGGDLSLITPAFTFWQNASIKAAVIAADPFFNNHRPPLVNAANNKGVAAIYQWREFVDTGGLMSLGPKLSEAYKLAAIYTARILRGERPIDLPILSLTNFELVINLSTAKQLGITVPESLLSRANDIVVRAP
jgi:putative ABC transport system substrate-binding protein